MNDGTVFGYAPDIEMGVIKTRDGQRFIFVKEDWPSSETTPTAGVMVAFEASGPVAKKIKIVSPS